MDLYSLISCIPISTNHFAQKCDCFQNHSEIFLFPNHIMKKVKTSGEILIVDSIMSIFV